MYSYYPDKPINNISKPSVGFLHGVQSTARLHPVTLSAPTAVPQPVASHHGQHGAVGYAGTGGTAPPAAPLRRDPARVCEDLRQSARSDTKVPRDLDAASKLFWKTEQRFGLCSVH